MVHRYRANADNRYTTRCGSYIYARTNLLSCHRFYTVPHGCPTTQLSGVFLHSRSHIFRSARSNARTRLVSRPRPYFSGLGSGNISYIELFPAEFNNCPYHHARSKGYCSCPMCMYVCLFVVFCHHAHLDPEI